MATSFERLAGSWQGSNGFRLMPTDELSDAPATAQLFTAAGGHDVVLTYTWAHPDDGPQDGVLLVGSPDDQTQVVTAAWGDSWHQKPHLLVVTGTLTERHLEVSADYGGGWRWVISLESDQEDRLALTMYNVVPVEYAPDEASAGPYPVMVAEFRRG